MSLSFETTTQFGKVMAMAAMRMSIAPITRPSRLSRAASRPNSWDAARDNGQHFSPPSVAQEWKILVLRRTVLNSEEQLSNDQFARANDRAALAGLPGPQVHIVAMVYEIADRVGVQEIANQGKRSSTSLSRLAVAFWLILRSQASASVSCCGVILRG